MEQIALFEEKIYLSPKDMNHIGAQTIDAVLLGHLKEKLENKCSRHGFVVPNSLDVLSRSMGQIENGKFTGNIIFHVQAQGRVYNPANGTRIVGRILKKNKMGIYMIYKNAIRILVPRDLHIGNEEFEALQPQDTIEVEIRKSRFQMNDKYILSVAVFVGRFGVNMATIKGPEANSAPVPAPIQNNQENESENESESPATEENEQEEGELLEGL
jgi:DNA-directed RNA polymerase subunit E'/Rpb7